MQPRQSYLVCATPRSGSTLFCEVLGKSGIAGQPKEFFEELKHTGLPRQPQEYFEASDNDDVMGLLGHLPHRVSPMRLTEWEGAGYRQFVSEVLEEGTTPNGVFGAKMMWGYFDDFLSNLRRVSEFMHVSVYDLLASVFPDLRYIYITRQDKVRQAVSLWKAIQTQVWRKNVAPLQEGSNKALTFHFNAIDHLVRQIVAHEAAWWQFFQAGGLEPLVIVYEEMVEALETTIQNALCYLAVPVPEELVLFDHGMERQADMQSEEWVQCYHALKQTSYR